MEKTPAPRIARLRLRDRGVTLSLQVYNPTQELPPKVEFDNLGANYRFKHENFASPTGVQLFAGEHRLCFEGYLRGAQPEGWRFGTPTAPTESKPRPYRRLGRGSEGLLLGTPPSVRAAKVREDKVSMNTEANTGSERRCLSSLILGPEDEDMRRQGNTSIVARIKQRTSWSSSVRTKSLGSGGGRC